MAPARSILVIHTREEWLVARETRKTCAFPPDR